MPGVTAVEHATDVLGRPGVGNEWTYQGMTTVVIFSRRDYAYLGDKTMAPGQPASGSALVSFRVVDSLPPHAPFPAPAKRRRPGRPAATPTPGGSAAP